MTERTPHDPNCEWELFYDSWPEKVYGRKWKLCTPHIEYQAKYQDALSPVKKDSTS